MFFKKKKSQKVQEEIETLIAEPLPFIPKDKWSFLRRFDPMDEVEIGRPQVQWIVIRNEQNNHPFN